MTPRAVGIATLLLATTPAIAHAEDAPPRFARAGQIILTADRLVPLVSHTWQSIEAQEGSTSLVTKDSGTSIAFVGREPNLGTAHTVPRLAFDIAPFEGLTLGAGLAFAVGVAGQHEETRTSAGLPDVTRRSDAPRGTLLGFAPRIGYALPLRRDLYLWSRAGFSFYAVSTTTEQSTSESTSRSETTDSLFSIDLDALLAWRPSDHVVLLGGPLVDVPLLGAHATELAQAGIVKDRSDQLRVLHVGIALSLGVTFDP